MPKNMSNWAPPELRKPIKNLTARELFDELVEDAVLLTATPLGRMVTAIEKIAGSWKLTGDEVWQRIVDAKAERTGNRQMPLA